jgi:hypothetical protein
MCVDYEDKPNYAKGDTLAKCNQINVLRVLNGISLLAVRPNTLPEHHPHSGRLRVHGLWRRLDSARPLTTVCCAVSGCSAAPRW